MGETYEALLFDSLEEGNLPLIDNLGRAEGLKGIFDVNRFEFKTNKDMM